MYPAGELTRLSVRKAMVRVRIAEHRWQCVEAGNNLSRPVEVVDGLLAKWRQISPVAKAVGTPLVLLAVKKLFLKRLHHMAGIARAVQVIFQTARMVSGWKT
jgi:hypothetical protein